LKKTIVHRSECLCVHLFHLVGGIECFIVPVDLEALEELRLRVGANLVGRKKVGVAAIY